jgi:hypothetical protein
MKCYFRPLEIRISLSTSPKPGLRPAFQCDYSRYKDEMSRINQQEPRRWFILLLHHSNTFPQYFRKMVNLLLALFDHT